VGRKRATVEYLEKLVEFADGTAEFCRRTGIRPSNLRAYLEAQKSVSWKRLRRASEQVFGEPPAFVSVVEGHDLRSTPNVSFLPTGPGLYGLFDSAMRLVYLGKATNLRTEVKQTLGRGIGGKIRPWTGARNLKYRQVSAFISAYEIRRGDPDFRHDIEAFGLRLFVNNTFNTNGASFKRKR